MPKLLGALFFAAALMLGLGASPSVTHACPMQNAQAEKDSSPVQLAMEESDERASEASLSTDKDDEEKSE